MRANELTHEPHLENPLAVGLRFAGFGPHRFGVVLEIVEPLVLEDGAASRRELEPIDLVRHRSRDLDQSIGHGIDGFLVALEHAHRHAEVLLGLRHHRVAIGRGLIDTGVLDAVLGHERLAQLPELLTVARVRRAVGLVVVDQVAAPLACLEPGHRRYAVIPAASGVEHRAGHGRELGALLGRTDAPAVGREPIRRRAVTTDETALSSIP